MLFQTMEKEGIYIIYITEFEKYDANLRNYSKAEFSTYKSLLRKNALPNATLYYLGDELNIHQVDQGRQQLPRLKVDHLKKSDYL